MSKRIIGAETPASLRKKTPPGRSRTAHAKGEGLKSRLGGTSLPERPGRSQVGLGPGGRGWVSDLPSHRSSNKTTLLANSDT